MMFANSRNLFFPLLLDFTKKYELVLVPEFIPKLSKIHDIAYSHPKISVGRHPDPLLPNLHSTLDFDITRLNKLNELLFFSAYKIQSFWLLKPPYHNNINIKPSPFFLSFTLTLKLQIWPLHFWLASYRPDWRVNLKYKVRKSTTNFGKGLVSTTSMWLSPFTNRKFLKND